MFLEPEFKVVMVETVDVIRTSFTSDEEDDTLPEQELD